MKIVTIGDLHGSKYWEQIVKDNPDADKFIFLGDYVDSFEYSDTQIIKNLQNIIKFKKENPKKAELLLGNHDIQYIYPGNNCSGRRESITLILKILFENDIGFFKICHSEIINGKTYLFSHAGFTKTWEKLNQPIFEDYFPEGFFEYPQLNFILQTHNKDIFFSVGKSRGGIGVSGPLWADRTETLEDGIEVTDLIQVVGHTKVPTLEITDKIIYCDNINYGDKKVLILEDNK